MNPISPLQTDSQNLPALLQLARDEAARFLSDVAARPANASWDGPAPARLPARGLGAKQALQNFTQIYGDAMSGSAGPRYFGFVTGGSTPAALMGDWLTSAYDQNASDRTSMAAAHIEASATSLLRELFGLPDDFAGRFVSGATMSNFVGLAIGRQWWGAQHGQNIAADGLGGLPTPIVLSGSPHSCVYKSLSMLGMGRASLRPVPTLPDREAVNTAALKRALQELAGQPCIVVANAGVVNTVDFDDLEAIAQLKREFNFYLHVDAAFGGFAACSPKYRHLVAGWEAADSIAVDAHKWLNVPYDSAVQFTRHPNWQAEVFQNAGAAYLGEPNAADALHLTPENSRRLRALPVWFTLMAYGAEGYREMVEASCACAKLLEERIAGSSAFRLLAPARMNVVPFTLGEAGASAEQVAQFLQRLRDGGQTFLSPTVYKGVAGMRAAFSNWRTQPADVEIAWRGMLDAARGM
ncbi:MAG TPA: pyridoxal-dependent decarboxylase [Thermoflexales bacterium]|nr:pyridoxal-dependent decarboxylase [Thermoflexales bacterium]